MGCLLLPADALQGSSGCSGKARQQTCSPKSKAINPQFRCSRRQCCSLSRRENIHCEHSLCDLTYRRDRTYKLIYRNKAEDEDTKDERRSLRKEAETLVRAAERDLHRLLLQKTSEDVGTQTEGSQTVFQGAGRPPNDNSNVFNMTSNNQIELWDDSLNDTARWLYQLVFMSDQQLERQSVGAFGAADFLVTSRRAPKRIVVDRLLLHWTTLEPSEIRTTRISNTASSPGKHI